MIRDSETGELRFIGKAIILAVAVVLFGLVYGASKLFNTKRIAISDSMELYAISDVDVRAGAGKNYRIINKAQRGALLKVTETKSHWYRVRLPGGETGWVLNKFLSKSKVLELPQKTLAKNEPQKADNGRTTEPSASIEKKKGGYSNREILKKNTAIDNGNGLYHNIETKKATGKQEPFSGKPTLPAQAGASQGQAAKPAGQSPEKQEKPSQAQTITPNIDPSKLEGDINRALRNAGLNGITAEVSEGLEVILKGSAGSRFQKEQAFEIARTFKDVRRVRDRIYVVD